MNQTILKEIQNAESLQMQNRINKLENSKQMIDQINRKLSHSIMLPLNSVCLIPSKIIETNQVNPN